MSDQKIILPGPLLLVGCGKMGGALLRGWLSRGVPGAHVFVVDPAPRDLEDVQARGVTIATALDQLPAGLQPGIVLLAIKPQFMDEALPAYRRFVMPGTISCRSPPARPSPISRTSSAPRPPWRARCPTPRPRSAAA